MKYKKIEIYYKDNNGTIYPKFDFITNKILNFNYFTYSKISVEWWDLLFNSMKINNINFLNCKNVCSNNVYEGMSNYWETNQRRKRDWKTSPDVFKDVIEFITKPYPENFILGFTDRTPGRNLKKSNYPDFHRGRKKYIINLVKSITPKNIELFDAMCWKHWAIDGKLNDIIKISNKNLIKIILVGPSYLNNFGKLFNINNFHYFQIDNKNACLHIMKYEKDLLELDKTINNPKIYLIQAGAAATWLTVKLHNKLKNSFIFDVGQAIDLHYKYNKIQLNT